MQAHMVVAHFAFEFGFGNQSRHRIDHGDIDGPALDQCAVISSACSPVSG